MNRPGDIIYITDRVLLAKLLNDSSQETLLKTFLDDSDFLLAEAGEILFLIDRICDDEWLALHSSGILVYIFYDAFKTCKI